MGYNVTLRRILAVLVVVCAAFAVVANAGAASGDLRIGSNQPFDSPNPFQAVLAVAVDSYALTYYDQLIGLKDKDQSIDYSKGLATGADVSKDGKTITFHLRTGITWSDGVPFTSADALWTFNATLQNKTNQLHTTISAVKSAEAPDAKTLVLHLTTRDSEFLEKLALPILPKHVWSKIPIAKLDKVSGPIPTVTTAPYMLTQWHKNGTTILERNPKYDLARNGGKEPAGEADPADHLPEHRFGLPGRRAGEPRRRLQRPGRLGARAPRRTRRSGSSRRRAAGTGRSPSTRVP